ncbi:hypothetical protein [Georgenia sunbinii]|uniref:hypothetical protein n=1 Tax=Georgenia sunbinii TaxID=3117728 RepID=UPI002F26514E
MIRRLIAPSALLLVLVAGCSSSTPDEDATASAPTDDAQTTACEAFFAGTGTPLAERSDAARSALSGGEVIDPASYSEVNVLEQRLTELSRTAPESVATLLDEIKAPFSEAVTAYNEAMSEGEEPQFPDLTSIDVAGSAAAQDELTATCETDAA